MDVSELTVRVSGRCRDWWQPCKAFLQVVPSLVESLLLTNLAVLLQDREGDERPAKKARTVHCRGVLTCQATSTLAEVVSIMAAHDAHQVFVVDPDSKPLSSITIIDALRVILDSCSKPGAHPRTPATPQDLMQEVAAAARTSGLLESATSCQSDRGVSACTSELSIPQPEIAQVGVKIQTFSSQATAEAPKLMLRVEDQQPSKTAD